MGYSRKLRRAAERQSKKGLTKVVGKSSLLGEKLTYVGFSFDDHPLSAGMKIQMVVYKLGKDSFVLCLSETAHPDMEQAVNDLGAVVDGCDVAPFAVRRVDGVSIKELQNVLKESYAGAEYHWLEDIEVTND
jgi:hypothetical protein